MSEVKHHKGHISKIKLEKKLSKKAFLVDIEWKSRCLYKYGYAGGGVTKSDKKYLRTKLP